MKLIVILMLSLASYSQDTLYTAKSINYKGIFIDGYVLCKITKSDTTFLRVKNLSDLPKSVSWRKNHGIPLKRYPKKLLKDKEVYQYHLRSNE